MADNLQLNTGTGGAKAATDEVTYSGDTTQLQLVRLVHVSGAEGSKAVSEIVGTAGSPGTGVVTVQGVASGTVMPVSDGGGSLTVDGTVSVDDGAGSLTVDNAALTVTGGGVEASALRVTLASDSTGVLSVDDGGGNLSIDDGGNSITVDGSVSVSGTVTVGSHAVTNAGTFAVQESGGALTSLQLIDDVVKAEDAAHVSGDAGIMPLAVRRDANTTLADTTGDYAPLQVDATGSLKVAIISGAGSGGTSATDDAAFSAASGSGTPMMGFVTADSVDSGDVGVVGMLTNRQLKVTLYDSGGAELSVGGGTQYTEDAVAVANPVGTALNLIRADALAGLTTTDGDNVAARGTDKGELYVKHVDAVPVTDNGGSLTVDGTVAATQSGTWNVGTVTTVTTVSTVTAVSDAQVQGKAAHDAAVSGNPNLIGAYASAAAPTDVSGDGDAVRIWADRAGRVQIGDGGGSLTIDGSVTVSSLPASTNTLEVVGDVAHDTVAAGNPVLVGGYASAAAPSDVSADGDAARIWTTLKGAVNVADAGGSLTVDNAALSVTGGGAEATALRVTIANDSTGLVSIDDNGGSLTVDNGGTFAVQATLAAGAAAIAKAEDVASGNADVGVPAMAVRKATPANTSDTDGDYEFLQMSAGRLWVDPSGVTLTVSSHAVTNAGTFAVQDSEKVADDAAFTVGTTKVLPVGLLADESSTDSVDEGDIGAARMTLDRKQIVVPQPHTAGGLSIFRSLDLDESEEDVKTSAGCVYAVWATNTATSTRWLKFYNATAANTTVGSTTPVITIGIPGNSSDDISANFGPGGMGLMFDTAICAAATTGVADADTGTPAANDVIVNVFYK